MALLYSFIESITLNVIDPQICHWLWLLWHSLMLLIQIYYWLLLLLETLMLLIHRYVIGCGYHGTAWCYWSTDILLVVVTIGNPNVIVPQICYWLLLLFDILMLLIHMYVIGCCYYWTPWHFFIHRYVISCNYNESYYNIRLKQDNILIDLQTKQNLYSRFNYLLL